MVQKDLAKLDALGLIAIEKICAYVLEKKDNCRPS